MLAGGCLREPPLISQHSPWVEEAVALLALGTTLYSQLECQPPMHPLQVCPYVIVQPCDGCNSGTILLKRMPASSRASAAPRQQRSSRVANKGTPPA